MRVAAVVFFFSLSTLLFCYPLSVHPGDRALDLGPDTRLYLWTLAWDAHALTSRPGALFDANIFYPEPRSLAYSEHLVGSAVFALPWILLSGNPLLGLNVVLLLSSVGCGVGAYFLARTVGVGVRGALGSGFVFAFAPPRFFRLGQAHLATVEWIPFCLAFLHLYARSGSRRDLVAAGFFFTLQALSGGHSGLFLALAAAGVLLYLTPLGELRPRGTLGRDVLWVGALVVALNLPFVLPYYEVRRAGGLKRGLAEAESFSPNGASFLAAPTHVQERFVPERIQKEARAYLFPGFLTLGLAALAMRRRRDAPKPPAFAPLEIWDALIILTAGAAVVASAAGGVRFEIAGLSLSARSGSRLALVSAALLLGRLVLKRRNPWALGHRLRAELHARPGIHAGFYVFLALFSLWAALGPRFGLYAALYRVLPGFDFIRVPARFTVLTILSLAVLAGKGLDRLAVRRPVAAAALFLLGVEFAAFPLKTFPYEVKIPPLDRFLATEEGAFGVVELPVADPRDTIRAAQLHSLYMLHSTAHFKGLVNGYSGFTPPRHDLLFRRLVSFPDEASLKGLEDLGVRYVLLHRDLYRATEWNAALKKLSAFSDRVELVFEGDGGRAYVLTRSKARPARGE